MSKVVIAGDASGTGTFTISAPNGNTDRTLVLPDEAGTVLTSVGVPASAMPAGSVLQVVNVVKVDVFSSTSTSYIDITGLSVSITPTATSSKILIVPSIFLSQASNNYAVSAQLVRGATPLGNTTGTTHANFASSTSLSPSDRRGIGQTTFTYLDSPATTSEVTYKIQGKTAISATWYINRWELNTDVSGSSSLLVMEIAG